MRAKHPAASRTPPWAQEPVLPTAVSVPPPVPGAWARRSSTPRPPIVGGLLSAATMAVAVEVMATATPALVLVLGLWLGLGL